MKILIIFIALLYSNMLLSQGITLNEKKGLLVNPSSRYPSGQASLGFGFAKGILYGDEEKKPFMALVSVNADQQLYKILYFGLGLDAYKDPQEGHYILFGLNLCTDFRININNRRHTVWTGFGALVNLGSQGLIHSLGVIFSLRYEYNIDGLYSVGLEIKHPIYITYNRSPKVIMVNLYGSVSIF